MVVACIALHPFGCGNILVSGRCVWNHNFGAKGGWAPSMRTGGKGYDIVPWLEVKKISEDTFHFYHDKTLTRHGL